MTKGGAKDLAAFFLAASASIVSGWAAYAAPLIVVPRPSEFLLVALFAAALFVAIAWPSAVALLLIGGRPLTGWRKWALVCVCATPGLVLLALFQWVGEMLGS